LALAHNPDERSDELLRKLASSDKSLKHIREAAIMGLAEKRSEGTYEFLRKLFDDLPDADLKESTMLAIANNYHEESKDWLRGIALSDSKGEQSLELRKMALHLAGEYGSFTTSELVGMYAGLTEPDMREQVIYVLGHSDDPDAVEKLIEIARSEKDSELRRNAILWIGYSGDDRAVKFLEELINE
jgi:HEAT repeat protein